MKNHSVILPKKSDESNINTRLFDRMSAADGFNQPALVTSSCLSVLQLLGSHAIPEREHLELNLLNDLTQEIIHFIQFPLPWI